MRIIHPITDGHPLYDYGRMDYPAVSALLRTLADTHWRVAVTGRPGVGKTHLVTDLAQTRGGAYIHLDEHLLTVPWEDQALEAVRLGSLTRSWVMEGVAVARAVRHGLDADVILHLDGTPKATVKPGALRLGNQISKWVAEAYGKYPIYRVEIA
jgi:hypothetical protein